MVNEVLACAVRSAAPSSGTVGPKPLGYCSVRIGGMPRIRLAWDKTTWLWWVSPPPPLTGMILSQVNAWQHFLLEGVGPRCWQCLWTGRCWVWTSPACRKGKALHPWWTVGQRLPLRAQGCKKLFTAKWILQIQIHIDHNSYFIF